MAKEECLAERVAITMLKADVTKKNEVFTQNEFAQSHNLIKEII